MPKFSTQSLARLNTCDARLVTLMKAAIEDYDFTVICGHRGKADQDKAFAEGKSKLQYPNSKHNSVPSLAVDIAPWPIDWDDIRQFKVLAEIVKLHAIDLDIPIEWGGDWVKFKDFPHWQLKPSALD